jgi:hypothetical protein
MHVEEYMPAAMQFGRFFAELPTSVSHNSNSVVEIHDSGRCHDCLLCQLQKVELWQTTDESNTTILDGDIKSSELLVACLLQAAANRSFQFTIAW